MRYTERILGRWVTDLQGQRMGVVTDYNPISKKFKINYWDPASSSYMPDEGDMSSFIRVPQFYLSDETEPNNYDIEYEVSRKFALADAALITRDRDLFEEAFKTEKVMFEK